MSSDTKPVVVGFDESPASGGALWWAVREARWRDTRLLVVHAASEADPDRTAEVADNALRLAHNLDPGLTVHAVVDDRTAGPALCRASVDAALVVVASRGLGGFTGLLLGSVSAYVATHAECPVLVIHRGERWAGGTRPVGYAGGRRCRALRHPAPVLEPVLELAFTEARLRRAPVVALRSWRPPPPPWRSDVRPLVSDVAELETSERLDLAEALKPWRHSIPM